MNSLNLYQLRLFCTVVERGSYSHAAEHLMMTQPALSLQIKSLESNLGVKLLIRKGNRMELTEAGKVTYRYSTNLLNLENRLGTSLNELGSGEAGHISISTNRPFGRYLLPDYVFRYLQRYPNVQVTVAYNSTEQICQHVLDEKADFGIVVGSGSQPFLPKLTKQLIKRDYWLLVCSSKSAWAQSCCNLKEIIQQAPLIGSLPETTHGKIIQCELQRLGFDTGDYCMKLRLGDVESIKLAVVSQLGIAFLPLITITHELESGELVQIPYPKEDNPPLEFFLVTKEDKYMTPAQENFIHFLLEGDLQKAEREEAHITNPRMSLEPVKIF